MAKEQKEAYLPNHKNLDDEILLEPPEVRFTELTLFVCTYVAKLGNLHMDFVELSHLLCENPHGALLAVNSNFGHACQPGHENLLKLPKPQPEPFVNGQTPYVPSRSRPRKVQGDGTSFNSAVEPIVWIDYPGLKGKDGNRYKIKCFPTTGETQVPGVVCADLSDGSAVLEAYVGYLNELGVGDRLPDSDLRAPVKVDYEGPNMMNYKWRLVRNSPRILINTAALAEYLVALETERLIEGKKARRAQLARFAGWPHVLLPPFPVRETKPPTDDVKVSFRFQCGERAPRVNVFQEGKMNILGANSVQTAQQIYDFFVRLFETNWSRLVCLQPRQDLERKQRATQAAASQLAHEKAQRANARLPPSWRATGREARAPKGPPPKIPDADIARLVKRGYYPDDASVSVSCESTPKASASKAVTSTETSPEGELLSKLDIYRAQRDAFYACKSLVCEPIAYQPLADPLDAHVLGPGTASNVLQEVEQLLDGYLDGGSGSEDAAVGEMAS
jgi:hypothetical protein